MAQKLFIYGTLKSDEPNHNVLVNGGDDISDLVENDESFKPAKLIGNATTIHQYPLVIASRYNIPFLLDSQGKGHCIQGEVYEVNDLMIKILDDFEGHPNYYKRRQESVQMANDASVIHCWTYFLPKFKPSMLELPHIGNYRYIISIY
jgi:gamma-glutamylaminecyclotransferase